MAMANAYAKFLEGGSADFNVEVQSPFGCVFGIRYGRSWTLYLQRSTVLKKIRFYKKSEVNSVVAVGGKRTDYFAKDTGALASKGTSTFASRTLGPVSLPGKKKEVQVFSTSQQFSIPLDLSEMYPNRRTIGDLAQVFRYRP